jgi:3-oxoacyl-(acyl-carrier-protein) synthase
VKALALTGAGVVCPLGVGRAAFVRAIASEPPPLEPPSIVPGGRHLEIAGFDAAKYLGDKGLRSLDRLTKLLIVATRLALHDSGLKRDGLWTGGRAERVGIVVSNAYGSLEAITELDRVATLEDARYINPSRFPLTVSNSAAGYASIWEDLRAVNVSVSDGNCGALDAVACANVFLEQQRADALIVGGVEAMSEALALAFDRLGALTDGARLGEGAALVTLETPESARTRGAEVLSTIDGYGTSFLAPEHDASLVHASPRPMERAIAAALTDASAEAREIDLVVSGVSGLRSFDEAELVAIERVLGVGPCVIAPKLVLGETLGAGGALGVLTALGLSASPSPAGVASPMVLRGGLRAQPRTALVTSMGYYGNASALVMRASPR